MKSSKRKQNIVQKRENRLKEYCIQCGQSLLKIRQNRTDSCIAPANHAIYQSRVAHVIGN